MTTVSPMQTSVDATLRGARVMRSFVIGVAEVMAMRPVVKEVRKAYLTTPGLSTVQRMSLKDKERDWNKEKRVKAQEDAEERGAN